MQRGLAEDAATFQPLAANTRFGGPLAGLTVLLVEESQASAEALRQICILSGARIRRANCLAAAMRHLRIYRPDVLITEMNLPDGDGKTLIRKLDKSVPRVPAILGMSAISDLQADAIQAGADGFVNKPVNCVAPFQHAISSVLPSVMQQWRPSPISEERIELDRQMLIEDMRHGLTMLEDSDENPNITHAVAFIYSIAVIADDATLCETAAALMNYLASNGHDRGDLEPLRVMLHDRLRDFQSPAGLHSLSAASGDRLM